MKKSVFEKLKWHRIFLLCKVRQIVTQIGHFVFSEHICRRNCAVFFQIVYRFSQSYDTLVRVGIMDDSSVV
jgi:hypothetical protein